jgi:hypothetical protein
VLVQEAATAAVSVTMPVTLDAAEKDPIFRGRAAYSRRRFAQTWRTDVPVDVLAGSTTTSAIVSRQETSLEWCS